MVYYYTYKIMEHRLVYLSHLIKIVHGVFSVGIKNMIGHPGIPYPSHRRMYSYMCVEYTDD